VRFYFPALRDRWVPVYPSGEVLEVPLPGPWENGPTRPAITPPVSPDVPEVPEPEIEERETPGVQEPVVVKKIRRTASPG
jgi:hypothetical protein